MRDMRDLRGLMDRVITKKKIITTMVFLGLIMIIAIGAAFAPKEVIIYHQNTVDTIYTTSQTVEEVINEVGYEDTQDIFVVPNMDAKITSGIEVHIFETEKISVYVDQREEKITIPIVNMEYLLESQGIVLEENDRLESNIFVDEDVKCVSVIRVKTETIEREVEISFNTALQPNNELYRGERNIVSPGEKGLKKEIVQVTYENNIPINEEVLEGKIIKDPLDQVIEFGTKERSQNASRHGGLAETQRVAREMVVESTAYTHTGNTTFTGIWPYEGIVAVDPKVIPLGTKMYVEGYGYATAADTGGLIKGNIIDVFMDTHDKAVNWGRRQVKIYILD